MNHPTLHIGSMMQHKSINTSNTISISLKSCHSWRADFDGDEMGIHIPQWLYDDEELLFARIVNESITSKSVGSISR